MSSTHVRLAADDLTPLAPATQQHQQQQIESVEELHARYQTKKKRLVFGGVVLLCVIALVIGLAVGLSHSSKSDNLPTDPMQRALALMARHPLIDGHNDLAWNLRLYANSSVYRRGAFDLRGNSSVIGLQTDIPRLRAGRLGGQFWSVYTRCHMPDAVRVVLEQVDLVKSFVRRYPDAFEMAYTADDVRAAFKRGRVASLMGMEGGHAIDSSYAALRQFYDAGVRYMVGRRGTHTFNSGTLTHNCNTQWAESCCDSAPRYNVTGLSNFTGQDVLDGVRVVEEMNRIGMIVDLSHTSFATMRAALAVSRAPVIFSHSGSYKMVQVPRNVPDDIILALKANGGVLNQYFYNEYVWAGEGPNTAIHVADHIDAIRAVCGGSVDHIGIGADFDGDDAFTTAFPQDMPDVSGYPRLIAELIRRGYTDDEVVAIMGGNMLRVLDEVSNVAQTMQANDAVLQHEERFVDHNDVCRSDF